MGIDDEAVVLFPGEFVTQENVNGLCGFTFCWNLSVVTTVNQSYVTMSRRDRDCNHLQQRVALGKICVDAGTSETYLCIGLHVYH